MQTEEPKAEDSYKNLLDLLAIYSATTAQLETLAGEINTSVLDLIDTKRAEYAEAQTVLTHTEAAVRAAIALHPEWFAEAKTIKTPYGQVHSQKTTSHKVADQPASIARIKSAQARAIRDGKHDFAAQLGALIRVEESVNLDACGELTEEILARYGIERNIEESVTLKPAKIQLGQAVKAADKRKKESEAAA